MIIPHPLQKLSVEHLKGVGKVTLTKLTAAHITSYQDLLLHLPLRYEDRSRFTPLNALIPENFAYIQGTVIQQHLAYSHHKKKMLLCRVTDGDHSIILRFMHANNLLIKSLCNGTVLVAFGQVKRGKEGLELIHPQYQIQRVGQPIVLENHFTAIYPTIEGMSQRTWRMLLKQVIHNIPRLIQEELLPLEICGTLPSFEQALITLHQPPLDTSLQQLESAAYPAKKRLIIEELLAHQLSMLALRQQVQAQSAAVLKDTRKLLPQFIAQLPYTLTPAQQRVFKEILRDMAQPYPMMRLLQGDVGSGKTVVAALASLLAISSKKQVVLMAPTEILAEQHAKNFRTWLEPLGLRIGWLAGKQKGVARKQQMQAIRAGEVDIVIGTHALFQEQVEFHALSLVIIDEQYRFGVQQRFALWQKGQEQDHYPHQLIMSATPIPRTLAMAAYAQLETSVIDELPPGRTPVKTVVLADNKRSEIIARIHHICREQQRQVYWVCTLIDESEILEAQAAADMAQALQQLLPQLRIGLVHGRMKPAEKQQVMDDFSTAKLDVLVATTVIEVGVDVPNATLMVIENAERLGLAQLHQLRGRVGRGHQASHCVLLYQAPLSRVARQRLQIMRDHQDGFFIAQQDLQIRGAGEILGTRQTGMVNFKVADLLRDQAWLPQIQQWARLMLQQYPKQSQQLMQRWLPDAQRYTQT